MNSVNTVVSSAGVRTSVYSVTTLASSSRNASPVQAAVSVSVSRVAQKLASQYADVSDTTAPVVTEFIPADGSTDASPTSNITLKFSEDIQRGRGLITIKNAKTGKVVEVIDAARSNRVGIEGNTLTLNPGKDLDFNTKYQVTFAKGSVTDATGNRFAGGSSYDFKTRTDNVAPTVTAFTPPNGSTSVLPTANLALKFNESVLRGNGLITLKNADTGDVVETFEAASSNRVTVRGNTLTLNPTLDLAYDTRYEVSFAAGTVKDAMGNAFEGRNDYSFKTRTDNVAPRVTTFTPADGSSGVTPSANITVKFSEAIQRGAGKIMLREAATGKVVESFDAASSDRLGIENDTLTLNPTKSLKFNTKYQVTFARGTVKDAVGNSYAGTSSYDFKTAFGVNDNTPPVVTAFMPNDGASNVNPNTPISVVFSEAIQRGTGVLKLTNAAGNVVESFDVATSDRISITGNTLTLDPTSSLAFDTAYSLNFGTGTVTDLAGNDYVTTSSVYDFRTAVDAPAGNFNIEVLYSGDPAYQSYFNQAAAIWQSVILGDLPDMAGIDDLRITASVTAIDSVGGVLGQAGPSQLRSGSNLPIQGNMTFDSADMANMASNGSLLKVIVHEMGHVLGVGTLWQTFGFNAVFGQYSGSNGIAAYRELSGNSLANFVPLETGGGGGTANAHWSESLFDAELMTGYAENSSSMPLSKLTIAALADLGYQVNYAAAEAYTLPPALQQGSLSLLA